MPYYPMPTEPLLYSQQVERIIHSGEVQRLTADNARLRAEVADLRERLAAAQDGLAELRHMLTLIRDTARRGGRPGN